MKCMCDLCPAVKEAMAEMQAALMSAMMGALMSVFSGLASGSDGTSQMDTQMDTQMQQDLMTAMCPMVGMAECFEAHPTECANVFDSDGMTSMGVRRLTGDL